MDLSHMNPAYALRIAPVVWEALQTAGVLPVS